MTTVPMQGRPPSMRGVADGTMAALWAVVLGLVSGSACVGIRLTYRALQWVFVQSPGSLPEAAASLAPLRRLLTPMLGAACATLVIAAARRWSRGGHHAEEYVEAVRLRGGRMALAPTVWRTASAAFSVASGAAIGREGSMIQFATAVTSWVGARSPVRRTSLPRQVACGAAAAVAAAYHAPMAGVFFATEIVLGEWRWAEAPNLALASGAGWAVSRIVMRDGALFPVHADFRCSALMLWAVPLSVLAGAAAPVYAWLLRSLRAARVLPLALVWAGCVVGLLSLLRPAVWGNADVALEQALVARPELWAIGSLLIVRMVATVCCVGVGTVGGVFTPTLFAGAAFGVLAGSAIHGLPPALCAVLGMSVLLAAVTHAPWMAACMTVELTGQWNLLPVVLAANMIASRVARKLSSQSLYAIATPEPIDASMAAQGRRVD